MQVQGSPTGSSAANTSASAGASTPEPIAEKVARVIQLIRPAVQSDGGDVELVGITPEGVAQIRLHGSCVGCPSSQVTLQVGIERNLKAHVPGITKVEAVN